VEDTVKSSWDNNLQVNNILVAENMDSGEDSQLKTQFIQLKHGIANFI